MNGISIVIMLVLILVLSCCSTMRQRTVVVSVYDYPIMTDSVKLPGDSVVHVKYQDEIKKQEGRKNFWKGTTAVLFLVLLSDLLLR